MQALTGLCRDTLSWTITACMCDKTPFLQDTAFIFFTEYWHKNVLNTFNTKQQTFRAVFSSKNSSNQGICCSSSHIHALQLLITTVASDILIFYLYIFFFFRKKIRLDILCELSARQMIHMKCQVLFSIKNTETSIRNVFCDNFA